MKKAYMISAVDKTLPNAATHLIWVNPHATRSVEIIRWKVSQRGATTPQRIPVQGILQASAFPTVVAATPFPLDQSDGASLVVGGTGGGAGTCGIISSVIGAGVKDVIWEDEWDVTSQYPLEWVATKDSIVLPAGSTKGFGLYLPASANPALNNWSASLVYLEG
jgi:hypothetical protein